MVLLFAESSCWSSALLPSSLHLYSVFNLFLSKFSWWLRWCCSSIYQPSRERLLLNFWDVGLQRQPTFGLEFLLAVWVSAGTKSIVVSLRVCSVFAGTGANASVSTPAGAGLETSGWRPSSMSSPSVRWGGIICLVCSRFPPRLPLLYENNSSSWSCNRRYLWGQCARHQMGKRSYFLLRSSSVELTRLRHRRVLYENCDQPFGRKGQQKKIFFFPLFFWSIDCSSDCRTLFHALRVNFTKASLNDQLLNFSEGM